MNAEVDAAQQALRTPRAAAISGIAFSLLLTASLVLIRLALPHSPGAANAWVADPARRNPVLIALNLAPFAGIAFLWFIGVVRDRIGQYEDRFFATVFLGSGLLFVAMLFAATTIASGLIISAADASSGQLAPDVWRIGREVTYIFMTTYAMRMASVFMIATATITLRTVFMPRWLGFLGYACALVLLLSVGFVAWIELLFPAWVLLVSLYILLATLRVPPGALPHGSIGDPMAS